MSSLFLDSAQNFVDRSYAENIQGHYLDSWGYTVPARMCYAANAVACAVALPFAALKVFYRIGEAFFSWGRDSYIMDSLKDLDLSINRLFTSMIGALISTQAAAHLHNKEEPVFEDLIVVALSATLLAAIIHGITSIPMGAFIPSNVFYSSTFGWGFGWHL